MQLLIHVLTHCGLLTPYGDKDLGQHWLMWWLVAWRHLNQCWLIISEVQWHSYSDNGLAPSRRQAIIIWTNADPVHWRIYVALEGDELTKIPECLSNHMLSKVWDEIFIHSQTSTTTEVWEYTINFIPHFIMDEIIYQNGTEVNLCQ